MKLSDYKGEEAVDVLAKLMIPAVKIATDDELQGMYKGGRSIAEILTYMMENYKREVLDIYAVLSRDKAENATPSALMIMFSDIMHDAELRSLFFASQGQNEQETPSGSATESIKDAEN